MSQLLTALALFFMTSLLPAQEAEAPARDGKAAYDALLAEYREENKVHFQAHRERPAEQRGEFDPYLIAGRYLVRFEVDAEAFAGLPEAIPFLVWIVQYGVKVDSERALVAANTLIKDHVTNPEIETALRPLSLGASRLGEDAVHELFSAIVAKSGVERIRDQALFRRASLYIGHTPKGTEEQRVAARADLQLLLGTTESKHLKRSIGKMIFEYENLNIGCVAPEIEGQDLEGVDFKLSDYRGKVVLLDFWGHW